MGENFWKKLAFLNLKSESGFDLTNDRRIEKNPVLTPLPTNGNGSSIYWIVNQQLRICLGLASHQIENYRDLPRTTFWVAMILKITGAQNLTENALF